MRRLILAFFLLIFAAAAGRADTTDTTIPPAVDTTRVTDSIPPQPEQFSHDTIAIDTTAPPAVKRDTVQYNPPYIEGGNPGLSGT